MSETSRRQGARYVTVRDNYVCESIVVTVKLPKSVVDQIDALVSQGTFLNRSDAIREAVRRLLTHLKDLDAYRYARAIPSVR